MKLLVCDDLAYVGSANFSDESAKNYEAGVLIPDRTLVDEMFTRAWDMIALGLVPYPNGDEVEYIKSFVSAFDEVDGYRLMLRIDRLAPGTLPKTFQRVLQVILERLANPSKFDEGMPLSVVDLISKLVDSESLSALVAELNEEQPETRLLKIATPIRERVDQLYDGVSPWVYALAPDNTKGESLVS